MKPSRMTSRSVMVLVGMLGGYGLLTISLILASYLTSGGDLAILVATGATSISVPLGGLLVILAAGWQQAEGDAAGGSEGDDAPARTMLAPHL